MEAAVPHYERAIAAYQAGDDHFWFAQVLEFQGHNYRQLEQHELAIALLQESLLLRHAEGDRFGLARSYREIAWVRFYQGLEHETVETAETALALQRELGDQQGIADGRFFLALSLLCCADWQRAQTLFTRVEKFALEMNNDLYQKWSAKGLSIATAMSENMAHLQLDACSFPNRFNKFMTKLMATIFSMKDLRLIGVVDMVHQRLQQYDNNGTEGLSR